MNGRPQRTIPKTDPSGRYTNCCKMDPGLRRDGNTDAASWLLRPDQTELRARGLGEALLRDAAGEPRETAGFDRRAHRGSHPARVVRAGDRRVDHHRVAAELHRLH